MPRFAPGGRVAAPCSGTAIHGAKLTMPGAGLWMTNGPRSTGDERTVRPTGSLAGSSPIISLVGSRLPIGGRIGVEPSAVMCACEQKSRPVHERGRSMAWCPDRARRSGHQTRETRSVAVVVRDGRCRERAKVGGSLRVDEIAVKKNRVDRVGRAAWLRGLQKAVCADSGPQTT